ncbi:MAG: Crp/Fnr family transcriptional regulator [Acidobacteriota bacterium]
MHTALFNHIAQKIRLTAKEREFCTRLFVPKSVRRKQYLAQIGDPCRSMFFVTKGALRSYTLDEKGEEHIVQFAIEDWWITDLYSFLTGEPSSTMIDAIEDSELLAIDHPSYELLLERIPKFERYYRLLLQGHFIATHRRLAYTIGTTAEARYAEFLREHSPIAQRVPQHMIASFLGITPETLSRIRKQMTEKS